MDSSILFFDKHSVLQELSPYKNDIPRQNVTKDPDEVRSFSRAMISTNKKLITSPSVGQVKAQLRKLYPTYKISRNRCNNSRNTDKNSNPYWHLRATKESGEIRMITVVENPGIDEYVWVMMHGGTPFDKGWLKMGGDWLIFPRPEKGSLLVVDRVKLNEHIALNVVPQFVTAAKDAVGKIYRLPRRNEMKTLIRWIDLEELGVDHEAEL